MHTSHQRLSSSTSSSKLQLEALSSEMTSYFTADDSSLEPKKTLFFQKKN